MKINKIKLIGISVFALASLFLTFGSFLLPAKHVEAVDRPFLTTWAVGGYDQYYDPISLDIDIVTEGSGYYYNINWGDGQTNSNVSGDISHTYSTKGSYQVSITGNFPRIYFPGNSYENAQKITSVDQ